MEFKGSQEKLAGQGGAGRKAGIAIPAVLRESCRDGLFRRKCSRSRSRRKIPHWRGFSHGTAQTGARFFGWQFSFSTLPPDFHPLAALQEQSTFRPRLGAPPRAPCGSRLAGGSGWIQEQPAGTPAEGDRDQTGCLQGREGQLYTSPLRSRPLRSLALPPGCQVAETPRGRPSSSCGAPSRRRTPSGTCPRARCRRNRAGTPRECPETAAPE